MADPKIKGYPKFVFKCGCISSQHPGLKKGRLNPCPVHGEPLINKIFKCQKCGKEIKTSKSTSRKLYCAGCRVESDKQKYQERNARLRAESKARREQRQNEERADSGKRISPARKIRLCDCIFYGDCMELGGKLLKRNGTCFGCKFYKKKTVEDIMQSFNRQMEGKALNRPRRPRK